MADDDARLRLAHVREILSQQTLFEGDAAHWAVGALDRFLAGEVKTLDKAFGLVIDGRTTKVPSAHTDWAPNAAMDLLEALRRRVDGETETAVRAKIGRKYGLGGHDAANEPDSAIASELMRILERYSQSIANHWAQVLDQRLSAKDGNPSG